MIRWHIRTTISLIVVLVAFALAHGQAHRNSHLTMGNPSGATADSANQYNYLMRKAEYDLSYNNGTRTPNWVSWHLSTAWMGSAPRQNNFRADTALPSSWYRVTHSSYTGSGFDRGHMCPSEDRTTNETENGNTFLMTNIIPQAPNNNQRAWAQFEEYCRNLARSGNELYIVSGPYGTGGTGSQGYKTAIDQNRIRVPNKTWKVVLVLPNGANDVARVTTSTRTIALLMPNDQTVTSDWRSYRTSVDAIELMTGYNFFRDVSDSIEAVIESRVDNQ